MKIRLLRLILILILLLSLPGQGVYAEDTLVLPDVETDSLENSIRDLDETIRADGDDISLLDLFQDVLAGEYSFDLAGILDFLLRFFMGEVVAQAALLGQIILLGVVAAVFQTLEKSFQNGNLASIGQWVIYLVFIGLAIRTFDIAMTLGSRAIEAAANFLYALFPILVGLLATMGGVTSMTLVKPTLVAAIGFFLNVMEHFLLPLLFLMAVLAIIGNISENYKLSGFYHLVRDIIMISLTLMLTIFTGILGLETLAAGAIDGLAMKTVKVAAGSFVPVVGRYVADAMDTILGASLLLKNSIGIFGLIAIAVIIVLPGLKILIMSFLFRMASAILQPFGQNTYTATLESFAGVLMMLFALVAATGLMFFIFIFLMVSLGNMTMMFR